MRESCAWPRRHVGGRFPAAQRASNPLDDLRDTVGCYGNRAAKTPHIDQLAQRGVRFERAYVQYPVCNPSRTSLLTGLRPEETGVVGNNTLFRSKLPDVVTLPQLLRQSGRYTAAYGKIFHLGGGGDPDAKARWMDLGKSWDESLTFQPTPADTRVRSAI